MVSDGVPTVEGPRDGDNAATKPGPCGDPDIIATNRCRNGLIPMIGNSGEDGMGAIDLFEGDDEGKFVLEGQRAE